MLEATRPKELDELAEVVRPRRMQAFFGAWDPDAPMVGLTERLVPPTSHSTSPRSIATLGGSTNASG